MECPPVGTVVQIDAPHREVVHGLMGQIVSKGRVSWMQDGRRGQASEQDWSEAWDDIKVVGEHPLRPANVYYINNQTVLAVDYDAPLLDAEEPRYSIHLDDRRTTVGAHVGEGPIQGIAVEGVFGTWDAPVTDNLSPIPTPVGMRCVFCKMKVEAGDHGAVTRMMGVHHRECAFREVMGGIGHHLDHDKYCQGDDGPDGGVSKRTSSLMVWALYNGQGITRADLATARRYSRARNRQIYMMDKEKA